jgi:hypothetical protein
MGDVNGEQGDEATVTVTSKLHFVDLAGSERLKYLPPHTAIHTQNPTASKRVFLGWC